MGFYFLLFNYEKWYDTYAKNCTLQTREEWNAGTANPSVGITYFTLGIIFMLIYIPCLMAMLDKDLIKNSCYKIMFFLGILDLIGIPTIALIPGIQSINGDHFCSNPIFYYVNGVVALSIHLSATSTIAILAIDRFFSMLFPNAAESLFGGKRIYIWIAVPFIYTSFFWMFQTPVIFNVKHNSEHFDPYEGTPRLEGNAELNNINKHYALIFNSFITVFIISPAYGILYFVLYLKLNNIPTVTKFQKVILMQSLAICCEMFFCATVYTANIWISVPEILHKTDHIVLICVHGDTPIVYLLLNKTLRTKVFNMIKNYAKDAKHLIQSANSVHPIPQHIVQRVQNLFTTENEENPVENAGIS